VKRWLVAVPVVVALAASVALPAGADDGVPGTATSTTSTTSSTTTTTTASTTTTTVAPPVVAAATPAISATPADDLVHLQTVTVAGTGFTPGVEIGVAQCEAGATEPSGCDLGTVALLTAADDGSWTTPFTVRRKIRNAYETIDCAVGAGACAIGAANLADYAESAGATLAFDPTAPLPPPPTVQVAPSTGLVHQQQVIVAANGFAPNAFVSVLQCRAGAAGSEDCDYATGTYLQAGPTGSLATGTRVRRRIFTNASGVVDCGAVPAACEIEVADGSDLFAVGAAPISFDASVPPPPAPVVAVAPSTDLVHRQSVTVTGSGFSPAAQIGIAQCEAGVPSIDRCDTGASVYTTADLTGKWSATLPVHRVIRIAYENVDCTTSAGACAVSAANVTDYAESGSVAIAFDPGVPPPPPPAVTVTPSTGLSHGRVVSIAGSGFAPHVYVSIVQCIAGSPGDEDCDYSVDPYKETNATGELEARFRVRRVINTYPSGEVDCLEVPAGCELRYQDYGDVLSAGRVAIGFDPDAPLPPPPDLRVSPDRGLVHRQTVTVSAAGYPPNGEVQLLVCPGEITTEEISTAKLPPVDGEHCDYVGYQTVDGSGSFTASVKVRRVFGYEDPLVDCATTACMFRVQAYSDVLADAAVPLAFDPSLPPPPPYPQLHVGPSTELQEGTAVTVRGEGFSPTASVSVNQCKNPPSSERDCDADGAVIVTTDAAGSFTTTVAAHRTITTPAGATIDCGGSAGCVIGAANQADLFGEYALSGALRFGPVPPAPPEPPPVGTGGNPSQVLGNTFTRHTPAAGTLARTGTGLDVQVLAGLAVLVLGLLSLVVARLRALVGRSS
jgi:hypothetical protein